MTTTRMEISPGTDEPNGNSVPIYVVMLSIVVDGVDTPSKQRIGEFQDGYKSIADEFCKWFNNKASGDPS